MMTFKKRSNQEELMDNLNLDKRILKLALKDISRLACSPQLALFA